MTRIDSAKFIPGGCSTQGKIPLVVPGHLRPARAVSASGARFVDEDGTSWTDFDMALGSVVWGHGRPEFADAVAQAVMECGSPSVPSVRECRAAEKLLDRLAPMEQVRFFKSGADACSAAVRVARAATQRSIAATDGYHGWHDWSAVCAYSDAPAALGIPDAIMSTVIFLDPRGDIDQAIDDMARHSEKIAIAMITPEAWPSDALRRLSDACKASGTVLAFDEVTSHLKYGSRGVAGRLGLWPDLLCISKGIANGLPLAALLGTQGLMAYATSTRISTTYASESTALAALEVGEDLLAASPQWPSWSPLLGDLVAHVSVCMRVLGLSREIKMVAHPGYFSLERVGRPFKLDPFRAHIVGNLADQHIFTHGWFHGSDQHTARDWERLSEGIEDALRLWRGSPWRE